MGKIADIWVIGGALHFLPVKTRVPLEFGPETLADGPECMNRDLAHFLTAAEGCGAPFEGRHSQGLGGLPRIAPAIGGIRSPEARGDCCSWPAWIQAHHNKERVA